MTRESRPQDLVVIGSSAGGIDALIRVTSGLPPDFPAPIVVAQHLDPRRPSHLGEILARHSPLPVRTVSGITALEPGVVFLVPANRHVEITDHSVRLRRSSATTGPQPSVDLLFETASKRFKDHLIAVILSGTGSDGAGGARIVHEAGGMVVIQNPTTAAFPGMPRSLAPAIVDISLDAERIGPVLHELLTSPERPTEPSDQQAMRSVLEQVRARFGVDFGAYRQPTIVRRLQRRMTATESATIADYQRYIQAHPDEEQVLLSHFLIKVTDFFRDEKAFDHLRDDVLPRLIDAARARPTGLRIWSAGCSTGEEAYSVALLAAHLLGDDSEDVPVRIFATDLDAAALAFARRGVYPANALRKVPPDLVERYFTKVDGEYEIARRIREMMLFGQHDLSQMPPFPHIDLLMCRNVLMYFTPELQRRVLEGFAFALRNGGLLMLGSAETTRPLSEFFAVEQASLKIFRRTGAAVAFLPGQFNAAAALTPPSQAPRGPRPPAIVSSGAPVTEALSQTESSVRLATFPIGVVSVDRRYDIRLINPTARRMLGIHGTAVGGDLVHLLEDMLARPVRELIDSVFHDGQPGRIIEIAAAEGDRGPGSHLTIAAVPDRDDQKEPGAPPRVLLTITDITPIVRARQSSEEAYSLRQEEFERLTALVKSLDEMNQRLLIANEELAMNEESLRASNEEALAASADAQASTEELETYAEELQATTEELETLNEELKATVEELTVSNADLDTRTQEIIAEQRATEESREQLATILRSLPEPVVVVDAGGRPQLTNAAFDEVMGPPEIAWLLLAPDGKPLLPDQNPLTRAARGDTFSTEMLLNVDRQSRRFEVTGRPIPGRPGNADGGIVMFHDVTDRTLVRLGQEFVSLATHELRTPLTAANAYIELLHSLLSSSQKHDQNQLIHIAAQALNAVNRLGDRIGDLADVESLQSGRLSLATRPIDVSAIASEVVEIGRMLARGQQIQLEVDGGPILVEADATRIEQVLTNLLVNAISYAPETKQIDVRMRRAGPSAVIEVQDYGPGIPAADLPRIFTRYFRVERGETQSRGLGLGLYLAKEIMEAHGGTIAVQSVEGEGTTFTLTLPLTEGS